MTHPTYTIRTATAQDAALLAALGERAFREAFAKDNTPENMADYVRRSFSPAIQAAELAQPGSVFILLEIEGQPAGYARLQDGSTDAALDSSPAWAGLRAAELVRIYLLQAFTGHRLGDALMHACLDKAREMGVQLLWLGVWEHNPRAIAFYKRWGFEQAGTHAFQLGDEQQTDYIMARRME